MNLHESHIWPQLPGIVAFIWRPFSLALGLFKQFLSFLLHRSAVICFNSADYAYAELALKIILTRLRHDDQSALTFLTQLYMLLCRFDAAGKLHDDRLGRFPLDLNSRMAASECYSLAGDFAKAKEHLRLLAERDQFFI